LLVPLPFAAAKIIATFAQYMPKPLLTPDQLILLRSDNLVAAGAKGFADLGLSPEPIAGILSSYLARFRPAGKKNR
jgi:NADH dehydrogenase